MMDPNLGGWGAVSPKLKGLQPMTGAVTLNRKIETAPGFERGDLAQNNVRARATLRFIRNRKWTKMESPRDERRPGPYGGTDRRLVRLAI